MAAAQNACLHAENGTATKIQSFSRVTGRLFDLMPAVAAPTLLVSGIPMHRIEDTNPLHDTQSTIKAITPVAGYVLDTARDLGCAVLEAARNAQQVVTIELDPTALQIARLNPRSRALLESPGINQIIGDSFDEIEHFESDPFSRISHSAPALSLAGEL